MTCSRKGIALEPKIDANELVAKAASLPYVKVDRAEFLLAQFSKRYSPDKMKEILELGPVAAGVPSDLIERIAKDSITFETSKVTTLSFAAGVPGGFAMLGTVPADVAQYYAHVLRIVQKLAYLYGFPDISQMDDGANNLYLLFLGVMSGVQAATTGIRVVFAPTAAAVTKRLAAMPLSKGVVYPIVKSVATKLGHVMTKQVFAKGVGKIVPLVGGVVSAGITFPSYKIMAGRLHKYLRELNKIEISSAGNTPT